uniref:Uncharacterized protein n=1 Tax=Octopus bimaculoides TaxID=37653 RepID=A0A0L8HTS0_OCTBM
MSVFPELCMCLFFLSFFLFMLRLYLQTGVFLWSFFSHWNIQPFLPVTLCMSFNTPIMLSDPLFLTGYESRIIF